MQRWKRLARTQLQQFQKGRSWIARFLLSSFEFRDVYRKRSNFNAASFLWWFVYTLYVSKRSVQGLLTGTLPRHFAEISDWHRETLSQFVHKLVLCGDDQAHQRYQPYRTYSENNRLQPHEARRMRKLALAFEHSTLFSVVVPVYNARPEWIERLVGSLIEQAYDRWELILVDDGSTDAETRTALETASSLDDRITVERLLQNAGVVHATNRGTDLAHGEFLVFLDHDDELTPDALWYVARSRELHPEGDVIYSDEELVTADGTAYPTFKPAFAPELLTAYNYVCHLLVVRRQLFDSVGRLRPGTEGAQDYDLLLRLVASTDRFVHIPRILYRWHIVPASMSRRVDARSGELSRATTIDAVTEQVVQTHLDRYGVPAQAKVREGWVLPAFRPIDQGKVSIILCTRDKPYMLWRAVRSIQRLTEYPNYELVIVDNGSQRRTTRCLLTHLSKTCRILTMPNGPEGFNWARLNNQAARQVDGKFLLFLNDDVRVLSRQWLSALVGYHRFPGVGATGGRLLFPNRTIQHAGLIVGAMGWGPWHAYRGVPADTNGYAGYLTFPHNCQALTGACLMTRRELFHEVGGFDEEKFAVSFNDVDFCLRLREHGLRMVYVPQAELIHYEGSSRGKTIRPEEAANLRRMRPVVVDPYWNPNLSRESSHFVLSPRRQARNLNPSKIPRVFVLGPERDDLSGGPSWRELFDEMARRGLCTFVAQTVPSQPERVGGFRKVLTRRVTEKLQSGRFDLVFAQGANLTGAIESAHQAAVPSIWHLPEQILLPAGAGTEAIREHVRLLRALAYPYQVVFNNPHSTSWALAGHPRANFATLEHVLFGEKPRPARVAAKQWLLENWGISVEKKILLAVGRPHKDNGWETILEAYRRLGRQLRERTALILIGQGVADFRYIRRLRHRMATMHDQVLLLIDPPEIAPFYPAADVFLAHVLEDIRPTSLLEAMNAGLPVIGNAWISRGESIHPDVTGLVYRRHDPAELLNCLHRLLVQPALSEEMGRQSRHWLNCRSHPDLIVENWSRLLTECMELSPTNHEYYPRRLHRDPAKLVDFQHQEAVIIGTV